MSCPPSHEEKITRVLPLKGHSVSRHNFSFFLAQRLQSAAAQLPLNPIFFFGWEGVSSSSQFLLHFFLLVFLDSCISWIDR